MIANTPADANRFTRAAHYYTHTSLCLHDPKNQKRRGNAVAKAKANTQAKTEAKTDAKTDAKTHS